MPFILRAKQNRKIKGREYQLQAKNRTKLIQYFELICQNKRDQNNFACISRQLLGQPN